MICSKIILMKRLKELREAKGLSQEELAKSMGVVQKTISSYETGRSEPDIQTIIKLSNFFDVTVGYFLGTED